MTKPQKKMLLEIAAGADPNLMAQIARVQGGRAEARLARTMLSLYRLGHLKIRTTGGLEISDTGKAYAAKHKAAT